MTKQDLLEKWQERLDKAIWEMQDAADNGQICSDLTYVEADVYGRVIKEAYQLDELSAEPCHVCEDLDDEGLGQIQSDLKYYYDELVDLLYCPNCGRKL